MVGDTSRGAQSATFVRLGREDMGEVAALEQACFSTPWSEEQFLLAFEQRIFSVFALRDQERIVAYAAVYHAAGELEILNIAVHPDRRRHGLGRRLLGILLQVAVKMGITRAVLEVRTGNTPAIGLYEALGFRRIGVRPHYYQDTGEDALIFECDLADGSDACTA
ncbi:ribosomal protein S18-alanine N-acetyltransferase [Nitratidesulfovibrio vulgaris]|uniref:Ribosomal-protein-alanine acetyltransferase n=2 Tax=Nitratidesulfovibrio vulgaris TaxID=881 RepID=Q72BF8_NITV2|nr:ribosomal protein S18-alanine N-acetyltransferase [Nitratidesulfovibrio vulgaris]GEB79409.1 ribosomal-protein-alanine acetyltransferase [Desulfovibrio desulfuricans]HBW14598.1 ribosomal-protein-alanine N-acetyltransferase [Desulfovibrio sp.]AAS96155.1 ribosomal-protein-alanine acetyltransferase [Nitratidesulfovibrio vulgaris str. Hildenborough]ABM28427.1 [SSU ribosomal protein S18P]-alanine acetyltransferase [Nitratidesulfovibrio vulgaris DP4]ADP86767.1 ribosomal-protein-alanine acetyltrans